MREHSSAPSRTRGARAKGISSKALDWRSAALALAAARVTASACLAMGAMGRALERRGGRIDRGTNGKEALGEQRGGVVEGNGDVGAGARHVVTSNAATGQDREDGQEQAERKRAVAAVGDGAAGAKTIRDLAAVPSNQRASDSHDSTRLSDVEDTERLIAKRVWRAWRIRRMAPVRGAGSLVRRSEKARCQRKRWRCDREPMNQHISANGAVNPFGRFRVWNNRWPAPAVRDRGRLRARWRAKGARKARRPCLARSGPRQACSISSCISGRF